MNGKAVLGMGLMLLLTGMLSLVLNIQRVEASGTVYIRSDGTIYPSAVSIQRDGDLYTFTGPVKDSLVIERNNIVLNGMGYELGAPSSLEGTGITLTSRSNVTIRNIKIRGFYAGLDISSYSSRISVYTSSITYVYSGILLQYSSNNTLSGNTIVQDSHASGSGILLRYSHNNTLSGNSITKGTSSNGGAGISLGRSNDNTVSGNYVSGPGYYGLIYLEESSRNKLKGNTIIKAGAKAGIYILGPSTGSPTGNNTVIENTIKQSNYDGLYIGYSSGDRIYHNNFIDNGNKPQVKCYQSSLIVWNDGYPSGGNYWSDYAGYDELSGSSQNQPGSDGIGDTPYAFVGGEDKYPLMIQVIPEFPSALIVPLFLTLTLIVAIVSKRKHFMKLH